jgi:hypothetical protein
MKEGSLSDGEKMVWAATFAANRAKGDSVGLAIAKAQHAICDIREHVGDGDGTWPDQIVGLYDHMPRDEADDLMRRRWEGGDDD